MKPRRAQTTTEGAKAQSEWVKTPVANLVRYKTSGIYFARVRLRGKLFRQSLKTTVISVAKLRLADFIKERQTEIGGEPIVDSRRMTFGEAVAVFQQRLDGQQNIKEGAKVYRRNASRPSLNHGRDWRKDTRRKLARENASNGRNDSRPNTAPAFTTIPPFQIVSASMSIKIQFSKGHRKMRIIALFVLALVTLCSSMLATNATAGTLSNLYEGFLNGRESQSFVSFEMERIVPQKKTGEKQERAPDGRILKMRYRTNSGDYLAMVRQGSNFIVAYSSSNAITNSDFHQGAEKLYGFDGQFYWMLTLNGAYRFYNPPRNGQAPELREKFNDLEIIPAEDTLRKSAKYKSDQLFVHIRQVMQECLNVEQLGYQEQIRPLILHEGALLVFSNVTEQRGTINLIGNPDRPTDFTWEEAAHHAATASLDYDQDLLTVTRKTAMGKVFQKARYHVLAFQALSKAHDKTFFSWETYKAGISNVLATAVTNGATVQVVAVQSPSGQTDTGFAWRKSSINTASSSGTNVKSALKFADGTKLELGQIMSPAKSQSDLERSKRIPSLVYLLFILVTSVLFFLMYKLRRSDYQRR